MRARNRGCLSLTSTSAHLQGSFEEQRVTFFEAAWNWACGDVLKSSQFIERSGCNDVHVPDVKRLSQAHSVECTSYEYFAFPCVCVAACSINASLARVLNLCCAVWAVRADRIDSFIAVGNLYCVHSRILVEHTESIRRARHGGSEFSQLSEFSHVLAKMSQLRNNNAKSQSL